MGTLQHAITEWLPYATRFQIEDLCRLARARAANALSHSLDEHDRQVREHGADFETNHFTLQPRLESVIEAAEKNNLHVVVLVLDEMTTSLHDDHVAAAEDILGALGDAVIKIAPRRSGA